MKYFRLISLIRGIPIEKLILVDDCDAHLLRGEVWALKTAGKRICVCQKRPSSGTTDKKTLGQRITGAKKGFVVSHKNGNNCDFRRDNLLVQSKDAHMKAMSPRGNRARWPSLSAAK